LPPLKRLGIPDKFAEHYGSQAKLMEDFRFDAKGIDASGPQGFWRSCVGEQRSQFLARRGARAGRCLRA
jgi:hypothetical protein